MSESRRICSICGYSRYKINTTGNSGIISISPVDLRWQFSEFFVYCASIITGNTGDTKCVRITPKVQTQTSDSRPQPFWSPTARYILFLYFFSFQPSFLRGDSFNTEIPPFSIPSRLQYIGTSYYILRKTKSVPSEEKLLQTNGVARVPQITLPPLQPFSLAILAWNRPWARVTFPVRQISIQRTPLLKKRCCSVTRRVRDGEGHSAPVILSQEVGRIDRID